MRDRRCGLTQRGRVGGVAANMIGELGKEFDRGQYPVIVVMHGLLLVACIVEVWALHRRFIPRLGWPMVAVVLLSTVSSLVVYRSPRQMLEYTDHRHPGRAAGSARTVPMVKPPQLRRGDPEVTALPLVHTAWLTAIVFTIANALVLNV
jgi:methyltransferase